LQPIPEKPPAEILTFHNEELYGSLVTTLRIKNIVPPSSEPRPQQQQGQQERQLQ
jgi:hypothetical protein